MLWRSSKELPSTVEHYSYSHLVTLILLQSIKGWETSQRTLKLAQVVLPLTLMASESNLQNFINVRKLLFQDTEL